MPEGPVHVSDVGVLQAVGRSHRQIELVDLLGQQRIHTRQRTRLLDDGLGAHRLLEIDVGREVVLQEHRGQRD